MELNTTNLIQWFQLKYPKIVKSMKRCSHHYKEGKEINPYHIEGDVFTHTMLVMMNVDRFTNSLSTENLKSLIVCSLLHDIGKCLVRTVDEEKKRVHFYNHESISALLSLPILNSIEKDFQTILNKRLILEAISIHTDIFKLKESNLRSRLVNNDDLLQVFNALGQCDHSGRFHTSKSSLKLIDVVDSKTNDKKDNEVIVMIGLPASGKSTYIKQNRIDGYEILSRDDIIDEIGVALGYDNYNDAFKNVDQQYVDKLFDIRKNIIIKQKKNVIIDMTNMSRKSRRKKLSNFNNYNKKAIVLMASIEKIDSRMVSRPNKTISDDVVFNMAKNFYPPMYDEFDEIEWVFN